MARNARTSPTMSDLEYAVLAWAEIKDYWINLRTYREELISQDNAFENHKILNYLQNLGLLTNLKVFNKDKSESSFPHFVTSVYFPTGGFLTYSCYLMNDFDGELRTEKDIEEAADKHYASNDYPLIEFLRFSHGPELIDRNVRVFKDRADNCVAEVNFIPTDDKFTSANFNFLFNRSIRNKADPLSQFMYSFSFPQGEASEGTAAFFKLNGFVRGLREKIVSDLGYPRYLTHPLYLQRTYQDGDFLIRDLEGYTAVLDVFDNIIQGTLPIHKRRR